MKKHSFLYRAGQIAVSLSLAFFIGGCDPSITEPIGDGSLGSLVSGNDTLRYVALGNSLTAGYMNGSLYASGQKYAWTAQLAGQIKASFVGPIMSENGPAPDGRLSFRGFSATGDPIIQRSAPDTPADAPKYFPTNAISYQRPYNNLGVPGALSFDLLDTTDFARRQNPLFNTVLRNPQFGKSNVAQAIAQNPNLITLWIGNNDVLLYATSGGTFRLPLPGSQGPTPPAVFQQAYGGTVQTLRTALPNAKIVVATIPDVSATPFFTTVPRNAVVLTRQGQVDSLNAGYAAVNSAILGLINPARKQAGIDTLQTIRWTLGPNRIVIADTAIPGIGRRYVRDDEYILLTAQDSLKAGQGSARPLENRYVLDKVEVDIVTNHTKQYNDVIRGIVTANESSMALVDINKIFNEVAVSGYAVPGSVPLRINYVSGGLFSLDGVHPTPRGYSIIANEFIKVINSKWKSRIPLINVNDVPGFRIDAQ
jgi:hypothetical protein